MVIRRSKKAVAETTPSTAKAKPPKKALTADIEPDKKPLTDKQNAARKNGMAERAAEQLKAYFPEVPTDHLWIRQKNKGFGTIPRTLPIVMEVIDNLSKGQPAGHAYFALWCRAPDGPLVVVQNPLAFAAEAGFSGERAVDTWRRRMKRLKELGFIKTKKGVSGEFHYILLMNPNIVIELMKQQKTHSIQEDLYLKFRDRIMDIGARPDIEAAARIHEAGLQIAAEVKK